MPKRITFQFEDDLDYQMQAIRSTIELFRGLSRWDLQTQSYTKIW